jgi:peptidase E
MTRYVLVGGYPWKAADGGKSFVKSCVESTKGTVTILICLFARGEAEWQQAYEDDIARFTAHLSNHHQLKFVLAHKDVFPEQVKDADVIYLRGGETTRLVNELKHNTSWLKYLEDKTVVGTSAGADAIAAYYYALDNPRIEHGLGLLPIKVLVHYESDYGGRAINWAEAYKVLHAYDQKLELLAIREGEFIIRKSSKFVH